MAAASRKCVFGDRFQRESNASLACLLDRSCCFAGTPGAREPENRSATPVKDLTRERSRADEEKVQGNGASMTTSLVILGERSPAAAEPVEQVSRDSLHPWVRPLR